MDLDIYNMNKKERADQIAGALETALIDNALMLTVHNGEINAIDFVRGEYVPLKFEGKTIENIKVKAK
tara:strand:+ start:319 stop:522 length:204 start_codon:yes stop_codon:yes gene_type:complete